jgi:phosphonate transport system substrate-binding protein
MKRLSVFAIFLFFILFSSATLYAVELTIGLIPEQNVFKQVKKYQPVGNYIEKKTGIKIRFSVLSRYGNIIERFSQEKMDGAFWGSFTGALAINKLGVEPIARPVNLNGASTYRGYIFTRKNSSINSVERMKKKTFAFVDKATSAGYIFPVAYLKEHGVKDINKYFKEHFFTGSHDSAVYAVLNKEAEIGSAKNTVFDLLAREDPRIKEELVILATSSDFPSNTLSVKKELPPDIKKKLRHTLVEMDKDPEGIEILKVFGAIKFVAATESEYESVFEIAHKAGIDLKNYNYNND